MIVPFANPEHATEFGLVDASKTKAFRLAVKECIPQPRSSLGASRSRAGDPKLAAVHVVGNYQCSVVPDLAKTWPRCGPPSTGAGSSSRRTGRSA